MNHQTRVPKFILLFTLYLSQGLPFGFQATALPVFLRSSGVPLADIGFVSALALPWMLKALWAPAVDRFWSARLGRRKTWLLPLQALMGITMIAASRTAPGADLPVLLGLVFCMNLFAATQDIAVDGLAVDILAPEELGPGNAAQVVGYKTGMVLGGGVLLWLNARLSWEELFFAMALIAALPLALLVPLKETGKGLAEKTRLGLAAIIRKALDFFTLKSALWAVLLIMTYKIGEVAIDVMFKPFLVDAGFRPADIGLWVGTWGMGASLAGSLLGGWMVKKTSIMKGLAVAMALRIVPLVMEWWLTQITPGNSDVITVTLLEHVFGGMLTTAMFAFMMSLVNRDIGATHYTVLASIEVVGKSPGGWLSGVLAEHMGYSGLFALGIALSVAVFIPLFKCRGLAGTRGAVQKAQHH